MADIFDGTGIEQVPYTNPNLSQQDVDRISIISRNWTVEQEEKHNHISEIPPWPVELGTYPNWPQWFLNLAERPAADVTCFHARDIDSALVDELKASMG